MKTIVLILIILIAGAVYFLALDKNNAGIDITEGVITNQDGTVKGNYSIADIMGLGFPYECTFTRTDGPSRIAGVLRMAEDKVRGDFDIDVLANGGNIDSTPGENLNFASHLIMRDGYSYSWTSLQPIGYKEPIAESSSKNASPKEQAQIIGLEDKTELSCKPWNAVLNLLDLPTGIKFTELK